MDGIFLYKDIKNVYSIIFYEKSPEVFLMYSEDSIHRFHQVSDTRLKLDLLQEFIFIPLDIVNKIYHNKGVTDNKLSDLQT